jgi:hypothetical protein
MTRLDHAGRPGFTGRVPITISWHTEATSAVAVTELPTGVSLRFGDDHSGVALLGPLEAVHRLVIEADRQLSRLRCR